MELDPCVVEGGNVGGVFRGQWNGTNYKGKKNTFSGQVLC